MLTDATTKEKITCHVCGNHNLELLTNFGHLPRVASDCAPWHAGGRLGICSACSCVQTAVDNEWEAETAQIYSQYKMYSQSAGNEQAIFSDGKPLTQRSTKIFQGALPFLKLNQTGRLLDIGCANGELLRYFRTLAPDWKMVGFEIDDKTRQEVEAIAGVETFASGSLDNLTSHFDLITLIHVLEHIPSPTEWLKKLHKLLTPNSMVLIQVPNPAQNPYTLLIADHCSHFVMSDLINIVHDAGFEVVTYSDQWVKRELSILIKSATNSNTIDKLEFKECRPETFPANAVQWLQNIVNQVKAIPKDKPFGIWGTAIAATWLYSLLERQVNFFVDEDINRIGRTHLGLPVYSPEMAPNNSNIFIALTPEIANAITNRWSHLNLSLFSPPDLIY